jgi:uncharacterized protein with HEPN domain
MTDADPRILQLLRDIDVSARRIVDRLRGVARSEFIEPNSLDVQDIVSRRLSIIGEAAATLLRKYPEFCKAHPEIPLPHARGMRNVLVHDYGSIDWTVVWDTSESALPELIAAVAPFLDDDETEN